jgi:hypothetical protein
MARTIGGGAPLQANPFWIGGAVTFVLIVACGTDNNKNLLLNGGGGDGTRYNIKLPEPPPIRQDNGEELRPDTTGDAAVTSSGSDLLSFCVAEINRYRATLSAAALPAWSEASACTTNQCQNDAASKKAHGSFGTCTELGQNECPGWGGWRGDPKVVIHDCLEMMWAEGPGGGHYENMRRPSWQKVSCGIYVAPNGEVTAIQNFR